MHTGMRARIRIYMTTCANAYLQLSRGGGHVRDGFDGRKPRVLAGPIQRLDDVSRVEPRAHNLRRLL